jgi:hypothetical protein
MPLVNNKQYATPAKIGARLNGHDTINEDKERSGIPFVTRVINNNWQDNRPD